MVSLDNYPMTTDLPIAALRYALSSSISPLLTADSTVLFLHARTGVEDWLASAQSVTYQQDFYPWYRQISSNNTQRLVGVDRFDKQNANNTSEPVLKRNEYSLVLALLPRQREHARAVMANAIDACAIGGMVICVAANEEGARSLEKDFITLTGTCRSVSKHHCRVFSIKKSNDSIDNVLQQKWLAQDNPRLINGHWTRPGVFSSNDTDAGTQQLIASLPTPLRGRAADLGAGTGMLAKALITRCEKISSMDVFEAQARALDLAMRNLEGFSVPVTAHWCDVSDGISGRYDVIVSNPPFHISSQAVPALGQAFIRSAASALERSGDFFMVANRQLAYEAVLHSHFESVLTISESGRYKVMHARLPRGTR